MHDSYKKCHTETFKTVKTICRIHNPLAKKGDCAILMFVQSHFHPFLNFSPKSVRKCSFIPGFYIQMRSFCGTNLKIYLFTFVLSPILKKSRGHHTKVRSKKLRALNGKNWCCSSTMCWICVGFLWVRYRSEALNE